MNYGARHDGKRQVRQPWPGDDDTRWRSDVGELAVASTISSVWLRMHGAATPVEYTRGLTPEQINAMRVQWWTPSLVTDQLSAREMQVFIGYARGKTCTEIAETLFIGAKSVSTYLERIRVKTGLRNQVEVAIYAYRHGLVKWHALPKIEATDTSAHPPEYDVNVTAPAHEAPAFFGDR